jgi:hypothetical protein
MAILPLRFLARRRSVARIYDSMKKIVAKRDGVPTNVAADTLALERIDAISSIERLHTGHPMEWSTAERSCKRQGRGGGFSQLAMVSVPTS